MFGIRFSKTSRMISRVEKNVLFKKRSPFQKKFYAHIWTFILWSVTLKCLVSDTFASVTLLGVLELQVMKSQNEYRIVASTNTCYYSENQVFGGVTIRVLCSKRGCY